MLDFIEIGTSDFDTEIQKIDNKKGISIEPVKYYLDRLPNKDNCKKLNIGISNYNGKSIVYYVSEINILKYQFPYWIRGCNSIGSYHQTVSNICNGNNINIEDVLDSYEIDVYTLYYIMNKMNVDGVYYLKIDTEGHDTIILKQFYNDVINNTNLPHVILFECNVLSKTSDVDDIINLYTEKGYDLISKDGDAKLQLNLQKLKNKSRFTNSISNYYIINYPPNYDVNNLPHENTLEDAQKYCIENNYSGVTFQNGRYEVRKGPYLYYFKDNSVISWIYV
jgi:hypothetical protein